MNDPTTALKKLRDQKNETLQKMNENGADFQNMKRTTTRYLANTAAEKARDMNDMARRELENANAYADKNNDMFERFDKLPSRSGGKRTRKTRTRKMSRWKKQTRSGKKSRGSRKQRR